MNKIFITFLIALVGFNTYAQLIPVDLILFEDTLNLYQEEINPLVISSNANFTLSGVFDSENSILIKASLNKEIRIIPKDAVFSPSNNGILIDPPTSAIKIKPPGGIQPPTLKIYPNPVQTEVTFEVKGKSVNAYNIFDLTGMLKINKSINPVNSGKIIVSTLPNANYILVLNLTNGKQLSIQFIKN